MTSLYFKGVEEGTELELDPFHGTSVLFHVGSEGVLLDAYDVRRLYEALGIVCRLCILRLVTLPIM